MNTVKKVSYEERSPERPNIYLVSDNRRKEDTVSVNGKLMSKHELNEKLAYFYEHGGPIMDI